MNLLHFTPLWVKKLGHRLLPQAAIGRIHDWASGTEYIPMMVSREDPSVIRFRRRVLNAKPQLHRLVVHLTDHCNLNCRGCTHFSNIAKPAFADVDEFERDFTALAGVFDDIKEIYLLGGEPLLHPRLNEFMVIARKAFPGSIIKLMSNGVLVTRMDESFWQTMADNRILLVCDLYPIGLPVDEIERLGAAHGVELEWTDPRGEFFKLPIDPSGSQDPDHAFRECGPVNNCPLLKNGRLYPCAYIAYIDIFKDRFGVEGMEPTEDDSISIHENRDPWEIFDFLSTSVPWCRFCDVDAKTTYEWGRSSKTIEEWLADKPGCNGCGSNDA